MQFLFGNAIPPYRAVLWRPFRPISTVAILTVISSVDGALSQ